MQREREFVNETSKLVAYNEIPVINVNIPVTFKLKRRKARVKETDG